jgi:hypothetical protein
MNAPATTLPSAAAPELVFEPALPHDATLEPRDETIAEVQSLVCASRQLTPREEMSAHDLVLAMTGALRQLIDSPEPSYAVALAAFALRYREEHLL